MFCRCFFVCFSAPCPEEHIDSGPLGVYYFRETETGGQATFECRFGNKEDEDEKEYHYKNQTTAAPKNSSSFPSQSDANDNAIVVATDSVRTSQLSPLYRRCRVNASGYSQWEVANVSTCQPFDESFIKNGGLDKVWQPAQ